MFFACVVQAGAAEVKVFNVRDYGAQGDGRTADTAAINKAIEACSTAGGGRVNLPAGTYLSGTVHLRSEVDLHLEAGATLLGSADLKDYQNLVPPAIMPESKALAWHRALVLADGARNICISGEGVIDGRKVFDAHGEEHMRGPHTILLGSCRGVTLRDVSIKDSANYAVLLELTDRVEIRHVKITGGWDGVHFRGCREQPCHDVTIANCRFFTGDDSIAGRYWDRVRITDCVLNSSCNCVRLIGPATHLTIEKCRMYGPGEYPHRTSDRHNCLAGLNLQPGAWDGTQGKLDDVTISDIVMEKVATPFHFILKSGNTAGRIAVSRVKATGVYFAAASVESWAETPFAEVTFRDVSIEFAGGGKRRGIQGAGACARERCPAIACLGVLSAKRAGPDHDQCPPDQREGRLAVGVDRRPRAATDAERGHVAACARRRPAAGDQRRRAPGTPRLGSLESTACLW